MGVILSFLMFYHGGHGEKKERTEKARQLL